MNYYVLIWGNWLSCDPLRGSHDTNHPIYGVIGYHVPITPYKETLVPHLVATLIYLSQNYSYHIRGDRLPLKVDYCKVYLKDLSIFYGVFSNLCAGPERCQLPVYMVYFAVLSLQTCPGTAGSIPIYVGIIIVFDVANIQDLVHNCI